MSLFENVKLLNRSKEEVDVVQELEDKVVALFFSASWCLPSQDFVRSFVESYKVLRLRQLPVQVVYVPCDKTEQEMWAYIHRSHGDWLTVPFKHSCISGLLDRYKISAVPRVIIVRDNGEVISSRGRKELQDRGVAAFRGWYSILKPSARVADMISMETGPPTSPSPSASSTPRRTIVEVGKSMSKGEGDEQEVEREQGDGRGKTHTRNVTFKDLQANEDDLKDETKSVIIESS